MPQIQIFYQEVSHIIIFPSDSLKEFIMNVDHY